MRSQSSHLLLSTVVCAMIANTTFAGLIGGNTLVGPGGLFPDVAYDSVDGKYLVVWYGAGIQGRFVTNGGAVSGGVIQISDAGSPYALFPAITYNSTNNEFLVTWDDGRGPDTIYAQRVRGSDGALLGGNFQTVSVGTGRSAVAWSATSNSYLVIAFNWSEVYGQRVSNTGGLLGGTFNISNDPPFSGYPGVSWGSSSNQYLVTWDHDDGRIIGQRVDAGNGSLLGGQFTVLPSYCDRSASAYDTVNNRWMVEANYHDPVTSYDQRCQLVSTSGTLIGGLISFATTMDYEGDSQYGGDICYTPGMNRFYVNSANSGVYEGQSGIEYNNATGVVIGFKNLLGVGNYPSSNCAADTSLNRYLAAIYAPGLGAVTQLYEASTNPVPGLDSNPYPPNGGIGYNANVDLSWTAGSGATAHNVYFGTMNPPLIATTVSGTSYDPGTLAQDTTYYWQVNSVNGGGTAQGPIWSFNTKSGISINLGPTNIEDLMTHPIGGDGDTTGATGIGGRDCRRNMDPSFNDHYFYFTMNDAFAFQGNKPDVWITLVYWDDTTTGALTLQYDASSSAYKDGGSVLFTGTNTWKTQKWHVTDGYFGNRQNNGGDFRIYVGNVVHYLDTSSVLPNTPGTPPPGAASNPSPANGGQASRNNDLSWTAGSGATNHNVYFGTSNPPAFIGVQTGTTYDPGTMTPGSTYYWRIDEYSSGGTTTGTVWSFTVRTSVSIDLGATNIQNGMTSPIGGDGDTVSDNIGGRECRRNMDPSFNDAYFYFTVDDGYAYQGDNPDQWIAIDYYDNATNSSLSLQYDGTGSIYTAGGSILLTGTNTWKRHTWHVTDAYFGNLQTNGGDFRIFTGGGVFRYLDIVSVSQVAPSTPLPGQASSPTPADGATGVSTAATLSWTAGSSATSHNVYFGTVDPPPLIGNQTGTTYNPGTMGAATSYYWRIDEVNATGTTTGMVWSFTTAGGSPPGQASGPNPADGATGVNINADLSWTAGSGATSHDVRFGTANPPPFIQNQTGTTYDPGTTSAGTTHYWRIDEVNANGTTTGVVWSFTTLPLPGAASSPSPANGATLVLITADLSWTAGSNATSHDVRFGTTNPPPFVVNQTATTYDPGVMSAGTTYYWRIDEVNSSGTTNGTVWSFTTLPLPGLASIPNPANGATNVNINADLSWTAGSNATSHNVHFGTANPPPLVVNQTGTTYDPGTMSAGTTYYWCIDEVNSSGTTTGSIWSFTTLPLPGAASSPNPANGATDQSIDVDVSWTAGSNASSHDVRFGTANPPPFVINQTTTTYNPGTLANATTYFWRIDEVNASGTTIGTVWSFSTVGSAPVPPCFFDNFVYNDGNLNGNGGWAGSATTQISVSNLATQITGGTGTFDVVKTVNCGDPGTGVIRVAVSIRKGTGTSTMWGVWFDDSSASNFARWYGTATTLRGRIGTTLTVTAEQTLTGGWDRLVALINPSANTTQFFFNGADLGVYDHSVTGAGDVIGRVRFERVDNSGAAGNTIDLDNLVIGDDDSTPPPGQASSPNPANGATGVATNATLSWTAGSGATSHDVRFGTANPPPFVVNQTGTTYNPGTLANGTTYYWRIDEVNAGNKTTGTVWSFTTVAGAPVTFSNSTFPSNAEGWTIVVWKSGTGPNGTMAWISSGGNPGGNMRAGGAGSADNTDSCLREGGEIKKLISTVGYNTIQVQYDRRFETNQTGTTCTGTCTANVLEGNCADKIAAYYSTAGVNGPWTLMETINASAVTQNVWATQTVNLPAGASNQANFALRFRWQFNRSQDKGRLDNIKVIGTP